MSRARKILATAFILLAFPSLYFLNTWGRGNFHEITEGEAYRSAQLSRDQLEYYVNRYHIRSILNLRGENKGAAWYGDEIRVSTDHSLEHYDVSLSADKEPTDEHVRQLLKIFRDAPRPILIHCKAGADRSGLVAAMWKVVVDNETKEEAGKQLHIIYGHIPIGGTSAMDNFFRNWNPAAVH